MKNCPLCKEPFSNDNGFDFCPNAQCSESAGVRMSALDYGDALAGAIEMANAQMRARGDSRWSIADDLTYRKELARLSGEPMIVRAWDKEQMIETIPGTRAVGLRTDRRTSTQPKSFDWSRGNTDDYSVQIASFNDFEIEFRGDDAASAWHQGQCEEDVAALLCARYIKAQFDAIDPDDIRAELAECGAWDKNELADDAQNRARILWIAAGDVVEGR